VEAGGHQVTLADGDDLTVGRTPHDPAEDLDVRTGLLDPRGADEDRVHGAAGHPGDRHLGLEGVDLPAEGVAAHGDVQPADGLLAGGCVEHRVGQHDHPGAGPVDGEPRAHGLAQGLEHPGPLRQVGHGGGLPAGDDEPVDGGQLLRTPHGHRLRALAPQDRQVLADVALQGQHTDDRRAHQPRVA
jgi:hypothetical protein